MRRLIADDFWRVYRGGVDVLLTPTLPTDAPYYPVFSKQDNRARTQEMDVYTQPVNMAGEVSTFLFLILTHLHFKILS